MLTHKKVWWSCAGICLCREIAVLRVEVVLAQHLPLPTLMDGRHTQSHSRNKNMYLSNRYMHACTYRVVSRANPLYAKRRIWLARLSTQNSIIIHYDDMLLYTSYTLCHASINSTGSLACLFGEACWEKLCTMTSYLALK